MSTTPTATAASPTLDRAALRAPVASRRTRALVLTAGIAIAIAASILDAYAAYAAGANASFAALRPAIVAPFVAAGVLAAYFGWRIIRARVSRPAAVLRVLVPVLTVLSFTPDVILLFTGFIPGTSLTGVAGLGIMHLIVVGVAVPISARLAPVS